MALTDVLTGPLSVQPAGVDYFEARYLVRADTIDQEMELRLDGTARYLQDVANENLAATVFADTDPYWIIRRTVIDVIEPISWPGEVTLQRWCGALSTRWANMRVSVTATHDTNRFNPTPRPPGRIETEAFWINVTDQGLPARLTDPAFEFLGSHTTEHRLRWKAMNTTAVPAENDVDGVAADRRHRLRITDFDPFRHLNNAAAWEAVEDELVDHPDLAARPHRAVIEYLRPIDFASGYRTPITVRRRREGDQLQMWLLISDADGGEVPAVTVTVTALPQDYYAQR